MKAKMIVFLVLLFAISACGIGPDPVYVDNTRPTLTIHSPFWGQELPTQFTLSIEVDEPDCQVYYAFNTGTYTLLSSLSGTGNFTLTLPVTGTNLLYVYTIDSAGNISDTNTRQLVWAAIPGVSINNPFSTAVFGTNDILITGTSYVDSPGSIIEISLSFDQGVSYTNTGMQSSDWDFLLTNILSVTNTVLARVVSSDNKTNYSTEVTYYIDTTSPGFSLISAGDVVVNDSTYTITGTAWDVGVAGYNSMWVSLDGSASTAFSIQSTWSYDAPLHPGPNSVQLYSRDNAGNTSASSGITIYNMIIDTNGNINDQFGASVCLSSNGNTMAVGSSSAWGNQGYIVIYEKVAGVWQQKAIKSISSGSPGDFLGRTIDLSADGNTLVLGVSSKKTVYIFEKGTGWVDGQENATLSSSSVNPADLFGYSVSISGDGSRIVVGVPYFSVPFVEQGAVLIFDRGALNWSDKPDADRFITATDAANGDKIGMSVSISSDGNIVIAGAPYKDLNTGAIYVITNGSAIVTDIKLTNFGMTTNIYLGIGCHIAPAGGVIFGGGYGFDGGTGRVLVYTNDFDGIWRSGPQSASLRAPFEPSTTLGYYLNSDWWGTVLLAGAPGLNIGANSTQGAVFMYLREGGPWTDQTQSYYYYDVYGETDDEFGYGIGVDMEARNIYIGIQSDVVLGTVQGSVYHYTR